MDTCLIGLPLSGKTTIFNALTGQSARISSQAGMNAQIHLGEVLVPDHRVDEMGELFNTKKKTFANVLIKDLPVQIDTHRGVPSAGLTELRNTDAIVIVVRAFDNDAVPHGSGNIDVARDFAEVVEALILADMELIDTRKQRIEKEGKQSSREYSILNELAEKLDRGELIAREGIHTEEQASLSGMNFVTAKPMIVLINSSDPEYDTQTVLPSVTDYGLTLFSIAGQTEFEIAQLDEADQKEFLADLGLSQNARARFLQTLYDSLNLMSFLTAGEKEVRAWSIRKGISIMKAAGKIHTDMEKGFIRAEVINYRDLLDAGGYAESRKLGKLRTEGKSYIVQDGDVATILFNV